ncbi:MAG: hypothetical protein ACRCYU_00865 [Nocardioides sp.]
MTSSAACLEDPARWIGVFIAIVGALVANPDATAHGWALFRGQVGQIGRQTRAKLANFIPALRLKANVRSITAAGSLELSGSVASARGITGWAPDASVEEKIDVLDQRTRVLGGDIDELRVKLNQTQDSLRDEFRRAVSETRMELEAVSQDVKDLHQQIVRSDASALPIIVVGIVLSGLAPEVGRAPLWLGALAIAIAVAIAVAIVVWRLRAIRQGRQGSPIS